MTFDEIEEKREREDGLVYETTTAPLSEAFISGLRAIDAEYDAREAYELDDPKHPNHYEWLDAWDSREGK